MNSEAIEKAIRESISTKERLLRGGKQAICGLLDRALACLRAGGKLMFCGNGGSSCDAAHAACELVGWFLDKKRGAFAAIALGQETPTLTAIANDSGYEEVFARQLRGIGKQGDMLIGISTSGSSKNVLRALEAAKELGIIAVALTGEVPGPCGEAADHCVPVPSHETPRIQESHLLILHMLCEHVEQQLGEA